MPAAPTLRSTSLLASQVGHLVADLPLLLSAPLYRRWHINWGATRAETEATLPGDDLLRRARYRSTRAVGIQVPPEAVWPWLVQMGHGRAGFYSHDLVDNLGRPSATTILDEHQQVRVGDWVPMTPGKPSHRTALQVAGFETGRWLLWTMPRMTWVWVVTPTAEGGTRLVTRIRVSYDWRRRPIGSLLTLMAMEVGDFAMFRRMLLNIRDRAEGSKGAPDRRGPPS